MEKRREFNKSTQLFRSKIMIMNKYLLKIIGISLLSASYGCSSDKDEVLPEDKPLLEISTTIQTRAVTTAFTSGDKMSIFVKSGSAVNSEDYVSAVTATLDKSTWIISPQVELKTEAYVFALYPYSSNINPDAVPVNVGSQTDFLYSGDPVKVSPTSPKATLTMKHALPMLAFNIASNGYTAEGKLTSILLTGKVLQTEGTLNVSNGNITGTKPGEYNITMSKSITKEGWTEQLPQMFCLPFAAVENKVKATFTIDGKEFSASLPEISVESGMKYLFRLMLDKDQIKFLPDQTEVISLNKDTDQMVIGETSTLGILYKGKQAVLPELTGNGKVTGTVFWGDNEQTPYSFPLSHTYASEGEYKASIQATGATAAEFENLTDIEEIDFSDF